MSKELIIITDTREQTPFFFTKYTNIPGTLNVGDYSVQGYETEIAIERKSIADACNSVLGERERFEREMERAKSLKRFAIVVEGTSEEINEYVKKQWYIHNPTPWARKKNRGRLIGQLKTVLNTYYHWSIKYGYPVFFCNGKDDARMVCEELLRAYVKYKEEEVL